MVRSDGPLEVGESGVIGVIISGSWIGRGDRLLGTGISGLDGNPTSGCE